MIKLRVFSGNRRKVAYVTKDFFNAPKPNHTQLKKEAEEFREYIGKMREKEEETVEIKNINIFFHSICFNRPA